MKYLRRNTTETKLSHQSPFGNNCKIHLSLRVFPVTRDPTANTHLGRFAEFFQQLTQLVFSRMMQNSLRGKEWWCACETDYHSEKCNYHPEENLWWRDTPPLPPPLLKSLLITWAALIICGRKRKKESVPCLETVRLDLMSTFSYCVSICVRSNIYFNIGFFKKKSVKINQHIILSTYRVFRINQNCRNASAKNFLDLAY